MAKMDKRWLGWLQENFKRNVDMEDILEILLKNKFEVPEIKRAMGVHFPTYSLLLGERPPVNYDEVNNIRLTKLGPEHGVRRVDNPKLHLYTVESFLTDEECDGLVEIINKHHRPSTIVAKVDDPYYRTSSTCDLSLLKSPLAEAIDKKIVNFVGINRSYSEGIEAQKYSVGQEFKAHADYFNAGKPEHDDRLRRKGNRTWTFMVYLNNTPKGGGTRFPNAELIFYPKKGNALAWNNLTPDGKPNPGTLHWGMQVEEGEKFVITKWFRERGNGNMLACTLPSSSSAA